ncbi:MAG: WXG100 family type VII secretion target [Eubacterium sp.]|nr:WXG100 family type VII secretion target [Eubacterium sp.]
MATKLGADATLKVTPEELQSKSTSVNTISRNMQNQYNDLSSIIDRSASYWTGDGGNAHRTKFNEQKKDVEDMFKRIQEHVADLQSMAGVYTAAEEDVKSTIQDSLPSDVII